MEKTLLSKSASVSLLGKAVIPEGTEQIGYRAFAENNRLRTVILPESVKDIASDAFRACPNLQSVTLPEGLQSIGPAAFSDCVQLTELTLPDGLQNMAGANFRNMAGLRKPIYNASGTVLCHYPCGLEAPVFTVPEAVRKLCPSAFRDNSHLQEVILPEGMERVHSGAFWGSSVRRITISKSVKRIEGRAFFCCESLEEVMVLGEETVIEDGAFERCPWKMTLLLPKEPRVDERLHMFGGAFLYRDRIVLPEKDPSRDGTFQQLAQRCAAGDAEAMWKFGSYFLSLGSQLFYQHAANFWWYRAQQMGHPEAKTWLENWIREHPDQRLPAVCNEFLSGPYDGKLLRYTGFPFFHPERSYSLERADRNDVVQVSSWCGDDGPDEDGFGREEFYDWWYLDESLNEIPGVGWVHSYSRQDKEANKKKFQELYDAAAAAIRKRR